MTMVHITNNTGRHFFLILLFIAVPFYVFSQAVNNSKRVRVVVTDNWKTKSFVVSETFWDNKKEAIDSQLGSGSTEIIKKYSYWKNIPTQMTIWDGGRKKELSELNKKLNDLKVYKLVSFRHIHEGIDWGEMVILEVPYEENKNWDSSAKWEVVYFIVKGESVKEL